MRLSSVDEARREVLRLYIAQHSELVRSPALERASDVSAACAQLNVFIDQLESVRANFEELEANCD